MSGMKKLMFGTIALIIAAIVFALMLNITKNDLKKQISDNPGGNKSSAAASGQTNTVDQDYLFFTYNLNISLDANVSGCLIDNTGEKFNYTLTGNTTVLTPEEAFSKVLKKKDELSGTDFIKEKDISNLCEVLNLIDADMEFQTEENGTGNGISTLYGIVYSSGEPSLIKIYSTGDTIEDPTDGNAIVIQKFFRKKLNELELSSI